MRNLIYERALGGEIYPLSAVAKSKIGDPIARENARLTLGIGYNYKLLHNSRYGSCSISHLLSEAAFKEPSRRPIWEPNLALLRVSHQVHDEVLDLAWSVMRKRFFDPKVFTTAVDARLGSAMRYSHLTTIELSFTNKGYFTFFGVTVRPQLQVQTQSSLGQYLQNLPAVKDLQLRFRFLEEGYETSPWGSMENKQYLGRYRQHAYECCQRIMVDWICTFAYPFVQGIESVTVTGKVKTGSKQKWNAIFRGAQAHNQAAEMAAILSTPDVQL